MRVQKPTRHVKRVHMETQPHAVRTTPPVSPIDTSLSKKPNQPERSCSTTAEKLESALASEASTVSASGRRQVRTCFVKHSSDSFLRLPIACIYIWMLALHGQILAVEQEIPPHDFSGLRRARHRFTNIPVAGYAARAQRLSLYPEYVVRVGSLSILPPMLQNG